MVGRSIIFVLLAAFFWGLSGGIGGLLMADGWDAFVVSFYRGAIGLLCVLVWLVLRPHHSGLMDRRVWFWSTVAGIGVAGNFAFYFISIKHGSVAVAATLMYCAPVFVYLVSFALQLERSTASKWVAMVAVMIGIVLLTQMYDNTRDVTLIAMSAGLLAGLSYALFIFGFKFAAPHGSPQAILSLAFGTLTLFLIWPSDAGQIVTALTTPDWPLFLGLGTLGAGLSFVLYITGLHHTSPASASIVAMIEPVTASLFGVVVLHETLAGSQIAGMAIILITVTLLSARPQYTQPPDAQARQSTV
jgi:drug/metabolite transporter, DME family